MPDKLITTDGPGTVIPLDPGSNSKTDDQGNEESGSIVIPENPVNLDESKMPPATTEDKYPPDKA